MNVLFVYSGGRKKRLSDIKNGESPSEFLFGAKELEEFGHKVDVLEMDEIKNLLPRKFLKVFTGLSASSGDFEEVLQKINKYDHVFFGNDSVALSFFISIGRRIKTDFSFFVMGQLANVKAKKIPFLGYRVYKSLIRKSKTAFFLGEAEYKWALSLYPDLKEKMQFLPFGVDTNFWKPSEKNNQENKFVLSIGNDKYRDWPLALEVAESMPEEKFVFVSKSKFFSNKKLPSNVTCLKGDWKDGNLSDLEIRNLYQESKLVFLPIKETSQPSGQSVSLQALACGKRVVLSDFEGVPKVNSQNFIVNRNGKDGFVEIIRNSNETRPVLENLNISINSFALGIQERLQPGSKFVYSKIPILKKISMGGSAISLDMAAILIKEIEKKNPNFVLEFGSGISTLILAFLNKERNMKILSIDDSSEYANKTKNLLKENNLENLAQVETAPLQNIEIDGTNYSWYSTDWLKEVSEIDLLFIDGPYRGINKNARYPALPVVEEKLSKKCTVILDDADRDDEKRIVEKWLENFVYFKRIYYKTEKGTVVLERN